MNSADLCRRNGWKPGTVIEGYEQWLDGKKWDRIAITAVGEKAILAKTIATKRPTKDWEVYLGSEQIWVLDTRDWRMVKEGEDVSELTIDAALKILNDNKHDKQTWEAWIQGSCAKALTPFEAVAIAREYLRLVKGVKP